MIKSRILLLSKLCQLLPKKDMAWIIVVVVSSFLQTLLLISFAGKHIFS